MSVLASSVLTTEFFTALVAGALLAGVPLLFPALGELVSERAGVLNIGLEGMMIAGAYAGFVCAYYSGFAWVGYGGGIAAGAAVSLIMVLLCVRAGLDQIVVGIAITIAAEGVTTLLFDAQFVETRPSLGSTERVSIPGLAELPVVGGGETSNGSLFSQPLVVYLGLGVVIVVAWMLRRTPMGLYVRAAGDKPAALDAAGVSVTATRGWAVVFAGAMAGLGGAYLAIVASGSFEAFLTQGRGFIAIVLAMLARGRPLLVVVGSLLFGVSLSISDGLQIANVDIPTDVVFMLPFLVVMAILLASGRRAHLPAALGLPYVRGVR